MRTRIGVGLACLLASSAIERAAIAEPSSMPTQRAAPSTWMTPRLVAVARTNAAKATLLSAVDTADVRTQRALLLTASDEYALAADAWTVAVQKDNGGAAPRDGLYWLADARRNRVRMRALLAQSDAASPLPAAGEIDDAYAAAIAALVTHGTDDVQSAAFFMVDVADIARDMAFLQYDRSHGTKGIAKRDEVKFDAEDPSTRNVVRIPLPRAIEGSIRARDLYVERVPAALDTARNATAYRYYGGEQYFLYGDFEEARRRLEPLWTQQCGKDEYGYKAWEKLIVMASLQRDEPRARALAEAAQAKPCTMSGDPRPPWDEPGEGGGYIEARRAFEKAQKSNAPDRVKAWREAAVLYERAFDAAPARREAVEGAFNAAYAYKQLGDHRKATALYTKLIAEYGSEERLRALEVGDPAKKIAPSPHEYQERVKYTREANESLATSYYSFFDYARAAEIFMRIASNERFSIESRRQAASNAIILRSSVGPEAEIHRARSVLMQMKPTPADKIAADYAVAAHDFERAQRDPTAAQNARRALAAFYETYAHANDRRVIEAAFRIAMLSKSESPKEAALWYGRVLTTSDRIGEREKSDSRPTAPMEYAALAQLALVDGEIAASRVLDGEAAKRLDSTLLRVPTRYPGTDASDIARARSHLRLMILVHGDAKARAYASTMGPELDVGRRPNTEPAYRSLLPLPQ